MKRFGGNFALIRGRNKRGMVSLVSVVALMPSWRKSSSVQTTSFNTLQIKNKKCSKLLSIHLSSIQSSGWYFDDDGKEALEMEFGFVFVFWSTSSN